MQTLANFLASSKRGGASAFFFLSIICRRFGEGLHEYVTEAEVTMVAVDETFQPVEVVRREDA